jgi:FG-GAP-like repeat
MFFQIGRGGRRGLRRQFRPSVEGLEDRTVPSFLPASPVHAGTTPVAVAVADFNGDGKLDMATADGAGSRVSLFLGDGSGNFAAPVSFPTGVGPSSLAAGDFNGDGRLDLVVVNNGGGNVSVLLGNGHGGFAAPINLGAGTSPYAVTIGDFNHDARLDFAVANTTRDDVSVFLGNGAGGFGAPVFFRAHSRPTSLTTGDFNSDGNLDLAVSNAGSDDVSVLLGDGAGGFGASANFPTDANPRSVCVADFNGDGRLDLAVANTSSDDVSVLLGNGAGGFLPLAPVPTGRAPYSVAAGDFNGDGFFDLVTANRPGNNASVLLGDATGRFAAPANSDVGIHPGFVVGGDFNGDGALDLAVANEGDSTVSVLLNQDPGPASHFRIVAPATTPIGEPFAVTIVAQDAGGRTAANWLGTVHFSSTDPFAVLPPDYTFTAADHGAHTFQAAFGSAGLQTLTVTDVHHATVAGNAAVTVPVTDLGLHVTVTRGRIRYNPFTGRYLQRVTLQNTSGPALHGPVWLVLDGLTPGVRLRNRRGVTRSLAPLGSSYVRITPPGDTVAPSNRVSVRLQFTNPARRRISYNVRVLAGDSVL